MSAKLALMGTVVLIMWGLMPMQMSAQELSCPDNNSGMEAQYRVAERLETARGVARNVPAAIACYERAAARGHAPSMFKLGMLAYNGDVLGDSVAPDPKMAWTWFTLASVHGEKTATTEAQRIEADLKSDDLEHLRERLSDYLVAGVIVPRSTAKAIANYSALAASGSVTAAMALAGIYSDGVYVQADRALSVKWFERAAELGSTEAMLKLATLAETQPAPDLTRAATWYERAAERGGIHRGEAKYALGRLAERANPANSEKAVQLYLEAARLRAAAAMHRLGEMYTEGVGVPRDLVTADAWFTVAAYFESIAGKASLQELEPALTTAQRDEAKLKAHRLMDEMEKNRGE